MKLLITGANGSLGAYLTRYFASQGHTIIALVRKDDTKELAALASVLQADIRKPVAPFPEVDLVIHCAALVSDAASDRDLHATNVLGTRNVLRAAENVRVFVHISSSSVYLPADCPQKEEDVPAVPQGIPSAYGRSKWLAEQEVLHHESPMQRFILRPRAVYGPGDRVLLPRICRLKKGPFLLLPGGLKVRTSLTHMKNLALVIEQIIQEAKGKQQPSCQVLNVVDPNPYLLGDIVKTLIVGTASGYLLTLNIPLRPLGWLSDLLATLGIKTRLTRFAIDNFRKGQVLDAAALQERFPRLVCTTFSDESEELIGWMRGVGGIEILKQGAEDLPWRR